jgi:formylglycine-generating enzyme required for sulfatase activity
VTQGQWKLAMGSNPSSANRDGELPVDNVSWEDLQVFKKHTGLSLPTEVQWEFACRAGTTAPFAGTGKLDDMAWYNQNSGRTTHPIGGKAPNGFGLHDLQGNVWEWCEDVYDKWFYSKAESAGPDPVCIEGSEYRIFRGGSSHNVARECRSSGRLWAPPAHRDVPLGFRVAAPVP